MILRHWGARSALRLLAALVGVSVALHAARADVPALPLVRRLGGSGRPHPLADDKGRIPIVVRLPDGTRADSLGLMPVAPGLGAIRLTPERLEAFTAAHPELDARFSPPRHLLLDVSKKWTKSEAYRSATGMSGEGVIVGIIDTGLDVAHPDFRDADGHTRVAWMLRQGTPLGRHPDLEAKFGCTSPDQTSCAILDAADLDAMLASSQSDTPRDVQGHGTHVSSIAAGNGGVMLYGTPQRTGGKCGHNGYCQDGFCSKNTWRTYCTKTCTAASQCPGPMRCVVVDAAKNESECVLDPPRYIGAAPGAIYVIAAPSATEGGFFDADVLNAARFIFDRADALGLPAVVNVSIGSDFGPHDGTSNLERGLAAYVGDDKPGHALVVAAGNSGALYRIKGEGPMGIHTEAHVSAHAITRVPVYSPEVKKGTAFVWVTFRPGNSVAVGLDGDGGSSWVGLTDPGDEGGYNDDAVSAALLNNVVGSKSPIDAGTNSAVLSWEGAWAESDKFAVLLQGEGDAELWLAGEGDAGMGETLGVQFMRATTQGTINVPASAPSLIAVGCTINRLGWKPLAGQALALSSLGPDDSPLADGSCYFSSAGPTPFGVPKPEISAPGAFVAAAMSIDADPRTHKGTLFDGAGCPPESPNCFVVDNRHAIAAGTSMSAPQVTGAVALLLQRDPTLTQGRIAEVLEAGARWPSGHVPHDYQIGPGELDVEGAVAALPDVEMRAGEPDVTKSWYSLSSGYARPDASWPVWGTIELRHSDGSVASGLVGTRLELSLHNAVVVQSLAKVRHGMWRFAVAAPPGTSGQQMHIDVTYAGVSLGERTLPIGTDVWTAKGEVDAVSGGCSCDVAARTRGSGRTWSLVAIAGALIAARRGPRRRRRWSPGR